MTSNSFGDYFRITTFGESHGPALGVVIDGIYPNQKFDIEIIKKDLLRRRPGQSSITTSRDEKDNIEILSGVIEGKTTGAPIAIIVRNKDHHSSDYDQLRNVFRPGHADFSWWKKFGIRDWRGGGRTSGRETVARVIGGAIARSLLKDQGIRIFAHVIQIGSIKAPSYVENSQFDARHIEGNPIRCANPQIATKMLDAIELARKNDDSLGGIVEIIAEGVPAGWGDPVFEKIDARLASAIVSIGAIKGVEFGDGFDLSSKQGSQSNDPMRPEGFKSNHMGGILGGITNGEALIIRAAIKPTSSIAKEQQTITDNQDAINLEIKGRHDPCICPRIVPVCEAMTALVLCDAYQRQQAISHKSLLESKSLRFHQLFSIEAEIDRLKKEKDQIKEILSPEELHEFKSIKH